MVGSKYNLKNACPKSGISPPHTNRGPKNHLFGRLRNLTATLTAYIIGTEHDIDNRSSALTTTRYLLYRTKMSWTLVDKQLQTRPAFLPTLCKSRIPLHCQASQTEISKQNSTKLCQMVDDKSCQQSAAEQLGSFPQEKIRVQETFIFRQLRHLMANIFWTKRDIDNRQGRWIIRRVP